MARKRDRLEIIYTILKLVRDNNNQIKITPLLRYTNVSSQSFYEYFEELKEKEFVEEVFDKKKRKHITATAKGLKFIEKYASVLDLIDEFQL